jgi:endonuclease/exonuclease/phosphatase family metal-dependent hydrolase
MRLFGRHLNLATLRGGFLFAALTTVAAPAVAQTDIDLYASNASARAGRWTIVTDTTAIGGRAMRHPDGGAAKKSGALASPTDYFEVTFNATANIPYRLWIHGKAEKNHWGNDSVFVQFSGSVTSSGAPTYRIGTTSATEVNIEECNGCGLSGWAWQDNGWGRKVSGPPIYFATTGTQRIRVQTREDGLSIDRIDLDVLASAAAPAPAPAPPPPPPAAAGGSTLLKVLDWNTHHGLGSNNTYSITRFVTWIVQSGANVVSLNEVEKNVGSYGNEDQPARYAALLRAATGKTWYYKFAHRTGGTNGQGNLLLSTFPLEDSSSHLLSYDRSVARIQILVNGVRVNIFSTHLDADSSSRRATQMNQLKTYANSFPQQHIYAGDFNAWPGAAEINNMTSVAHDAWARAVAENTEVAYAGNLAGNTRNSRIDYVFFSKSASRLVLRAARVFDTRDSSGVMPSDHRPIMATFEVR